MVEFVNRVINVGINRLLFRVILDNVEVWIVEFIVIYWVI